MHIHEYQAKQIFKGIGIPVLGGGMASSTDGAAEVARKLEADRWVVKAALTAISAGEIKLSSGRSCGINLSGQTLGDESFLAFVVDALDQDHRNPGPKPAGRDRSQAAAWSNRPAADHVLRSQRRRK